MSSLLVIAGLMPKTGQAVGISPAVVEVTNMVPHMQTTKEVWFSRSEADQEEMLEVVLSGSAAGYITPEQAGSVITFPAGEKMLRYAFTINTDNLTTGLYEATLTVAPSISPTTDTAAGSTQILAGAEAVIRFSVVGSQTAERYTIDAVIFDDALTSEPVQLHYHMTNTTVADIKPSSIQLVATAKNNSQLYETTLAENSIPVVAAGTEEKISVPLSWELPAGEYSVALTFLDHDNQVVTTVTEIPLTIVSAEALAQTPMLVDVQQTGQALQAGQDLLAVTFFFQNQGDETTTVIPILDVYRADQFIATVQAETLTLPPNSEVQSVIQFKPSRLGRYTAQAYGLFDQKRTNVIPARFVVYAIWPIVSACIGSSALLAVLAILLYRIFTRKRLINISAKQSLPRPKKRQ